jgi:O-methyltransferase
MVSPIVRISQYKVNCVIDPAIDDPDTAATRELNERLRDDDRVEISVLSMADGITLARKIPVNQEG